MTVSSVESATRAPVEPGGPEGHRAWSDLAGLLVILVVAAVLRLPGLTARGTWDADQGHDMLVLWRLFVDHQLPLLGPPTSIGDFHHGALYYYLLAPFAWLSGGNPTVVVGAIALGGIAAAGVTWWLARSMAGSVAGFVAGLLMAVSASSILESTFIWNPNIVALFSAIALSGAWQAHRTGQARWWVVAAVGLLVTMQAHVLGIALAPPLLVAYVLDLRQRPPGEARRRIVRAGLAAIVIVLLGYLPLFVHELSSGFSETQAALAFLEAGGQPVALALPSRLLFVGLRIVAWPVAGLLTDHLVVGVVAGVAIVTGLIWRVLSAAQPERYGARFLGMTLFFGWLVLGAGIGSMATVTALPVDHYHAYLDPIVFVAAGLTVAGLWQATSAKLQGTGFVAPSANARRAVRAVAVLAVVGLLGYNLAIAPAAVALDGGWPAAEAASTRILGSTGSRPIELRSLPAFKAPDAYGYPLIMAGAAVTGTLDTPTAWSRAAASAGDRTGAVVGDVPAAALAAPGAIVVVCDRLFVATCGGAPESAAVPASGFRLVDRFSAAPGRTISVYLAGP